MDERISLRQSNKGFTLVEIVVVMVIISILATITTLSLIKWQEYSTYNSQEENAELIYMAAKNKIAKLKADNALDELKFWGKKGAQYANVTYTNKYHKIDGNVPNDTIYYLVCGKDDYDKYTKKALGDKNKVLLFDILNDYILDNKILKANIAIEYSEDGTIYAVYYSDRTSFGYGASYAVNLSSSADTKTEKLYEKTIGAYYSQ